MKQAKLNILFRTAGGWTKGKELGLGHIYRSINFAKCLKPNRVYFLIEDFGGVKSLLKQNGFKRIQLSEKNIDVKSDIKKTSTFLKNKKIDILIVDRYNLKKKFISEMKKCVKTVVISDLKNIEYDADLVINGFIGFKNRIIKNKYGSRCVLGPKYQILSNKFSNKNLKKRKKITLLATFGGFDEEKISVILLKTLEKIEPKISTKIILGDNTKIYKSGIVSCKEKSIKVVPKTDDMFTEIANTKYGLCAGGLTTYEFAALNVPFGIISQNKHQLITAKEWDRLKVAKNLRIVSNKTHFRIKKFLQLILSGNKFHKIKQKIVDGRGAERVSKEIMKLR